VVGCLALVASVLFLVLGGCGGGTEAPKSVSRADLEEDGGFWGILDPALKLEMASICQTQQANEVVSQGQGRAALQIIQSFDLDAYVASIDHYFDAGGGGDIASACEAAKQDALDQKFRELVPQLRQEGSAP
jgi:hypothetical protein